MMASVWVEYLSMKGRGGNMCVRLTPLFLHVNMYMSGFIAMITIKSNLGRIYFIL